MNEPTPSIRTAAPTFLARAARRVALALASSLALAGVAAGCADQAPPVDTKPQPLAVQSFARQWATELKLTGDKPITRIYDRGDYVFGYTDSDLVHVLRRDTGVQVRTDEVQGATYRLRAPVVLKETVTYPTTTNLQVFQHNGVKVRTIELNGAIRADAVGEANSIYAAVDAPHGGGRIKKIDLFNRLDLPAWELQAYAGGFPGAPAVSGGVLYAAQESGRVYAVAVENREPIWPMEDLLTFDSRASVVADLKADDAGVYVPTFEGKLYCLNRINGQVKWQYFGSGPLETSPIITNDSVYQLDPNRGWVAINKVEDVELKQPQYNRGHRWANKDVKQILAQDDKNTFVLLKDNTIAALDKKTGERKFTAKRKDFVAFSTNTRDGTIFAADRTGRVMAIRAVYLPGEIGEVVMLDDAREAKLPALASAH